MYFASRCESHDNSNHDLRIAFMGGQIVLLRKQNRVNSKGDSRNLEVKARLLSRSPGVKLNVAFERQPQLCTCGLWAGLAW